MRKGLIFLAGILIVLAAILVLPEKEQGQSLNNELHDMEQRNFTMVSLSAEPEYKPPFEMTLIHSNDSHTVFDNIGGKATLIEEIRNAQNHSLLLSAGDVTSWEIGNKTEDALANAFFLNHLGFEGMVLGNHEFDLGNGIWNHEALETYIKNAAYPVLAANMDFSRDAFLEPLADYSYTDVPVEKRINKGFTTQVNGEDIGIFGVTQYEETITVPGDVSFSDYTAAAKEAVAHFEAQGIDKIIALSHVGIGNDRQLAKDVPGIDVIIGGHSHVITAPPNKIGDTIVVQAGEYNTYLGELSLKFDDQGVISNHSGKLHKIAEAEPHPKTDRLMALFNEATALGISTYEDLIEYVIESGMSPADFDLLPK